MPCTAKPRRASTFVGSVALMMAGLANGEGDYRFDDSFLLGSGLANGSLERFNHAQQVDPGTYLVDVYLNSQYVNRSEVAFQRVGDVVEPCFEEPFLRRSLSVREGASDEDSPDACTVLSKRLPGATFLYDSARLRLDLSVPQALLDIKPRGYVDPQDWQAGTTMAFFNYDASLYNSRYDASGSGDANYGYLGLDSGFNLGLWRLRHQSNYSYSSYGGSSLSRWNSIRTYAQRAIAPWQSELTVGDGFTEGNLFGSIGFRGARLASDDRMLPDSQRQYAPQVRGTAVSNARVVISQNGRKVHETTVAAGPFVIDDLYGTAYNGDLDVEVIEADGTVNRFTVPYAAVPDSMRPGLSRYSATLGQVRQAGSNKAVFAEATYQLGLTNTASANLGARVAQDYLAVLTGGVLATPYGAFGLNTTFSSAVVENQQRKQGWRMGLSYSRTFQPTQTTLNLAGYRYSTQGYRDLADALGARRAVERGEQWDSTSFKQRNQVTLLVNQGLGGYGNLYLSGSSSDYYDGKSRDTQVQFGYSNVWRQVNYSLAYSRQRTTWYRDVPRHTDSSWSGLSNVENTSNRTNTLTLTFSMPLGGSSRAPSLSSMITRRAGDSRGSSLQTGVNGTLGAQRNVSYAIATSRDNARGSANWTSNLQAQTALATLSGGYSQSADYRQLNGGVRGAAVLHEGGLTLGPYVGDTFALVRAKGARGAVIRGGQGAQVDSNGYALVPSLSPYRYNPVGLDPSGIGDDAELVETERKIAPYAGAAVLVDFKTLTGHALLIQARLPNGGSIPLGADVIDEHGVTLGMVGQGGQVYARADADRGQLHVRWGPGAEQSCHLAYDITSSAAIVSQGFTHLKGICIISEEKP